MYASASSTKECKKWKDFSHTYIFFLESDKRSDVQTNHFKPEKKLYDPLFFFFLFLFPVSQRLSSERLWRLDYISESSCLLWTYIHHFLLVFNSIPPTSPLPPNSMSPCIINGEWIYWPLFLYLLDLQYSPWPLQKKNRKKKDPFLFFSFSISVSFFTLLSFWFIYKCKTSY